MAHRLELLAVLFLMTVLAGTATAATDTLVLVIGGKPFADSAALVDGKAYIPLSALEAVGAKAKLDGRKVEITPASGAKFSCTASRVGDELMLGASEVASKLGAVAEFDKPTLTLSLLAHVDKVDFDGKTAHVVVSHPVPTEVSSWADTNTKLFKLIIDMHGVFVPKKPQAVEIRNSTNAPIRMGGQPDGQTARFVLDLPRKVQYRMSSPPKSRTATVVLAETIPPGRSPLKTPDPEPEAPELPPTRISGVKYSADGPNRIEVHVATGRAVEYGSFTLRGPDRLVVDIANAQLAKEIEDVPVDHRILRGIRIGNKTGPAVRIAMDLSRIVGYRIRQDKGGLAISLEVPKGAGGSFADKIIAIDAGHGGSDPGVIECKELSEKDATLAIARRLKESLERVGAQAFLTRDSDTYIALPERALSAKRHGADLFVSIHCNSCPLHGTGTGTETFYHNTDPSSKALAECIHSEAIKATALTDRGVKPDPGVGFLVLRCASSYGIPGVLLEVGFLDHPVDSAKIKDESFQQRVADAIVRGLKAYVEGGTFGSGVSIHRAESELELDKPITNFAEPVPEVEQSGSPPPREQYIPKNSDTPALNEPPAPPREVTPGPHRPGHRP